MYKVGDYVVKANCGVCCVSEIKKIQMIRTQPPADYYILLPMHDQKSKLFLPVNKPRADVRKVMTEDEAWKLIDSIPRIEAAFIEEERKRELEYKKAVNGVDAIELVKIIKCIYLRKRERESAGKKITSIDLKYYEMAEQMLYSELAFVIGRDIDEISSIIADRANVSI